MHGYAVMPVETELHHRCSNGRSLILSIARSICYTVSTRNNEVTGEREKFNSHGNFIGARMRQKRQ